MEKDNNQKVKRSRGRPTKFRKEMLVDAQRLAMLGLTEEQLAVFWQISPNSLTRWKRKNPELCRAIEKGRLDANMSISQKLFNEAFGNEKEKIRPNMTAIIFWLTNRQPELWRDRRALVNNQIVNKMGVDIKQFKDEELDGIIANFTRQIIKDV